MRDQLETETQRLSSEIDADERLDRQLERNRQAIISARAGSASTENGPTEVS
ncbi:MAG: hypothetical protein ACLP0J_13255 [Solirubrobacteraceae bacterium]